MKLHIFALLICFIAHNNLFAGGGCTKFRKNNDSDQAISPLPEETKHMSLRGQRIEKRLTDITEERRKELQDKIKQNYLARQSLSRESSGEKSTLDVAADTASDLNTNSQSYTKQLGILWGIAANGTPGETPQ